MVACHKYALSIALAYVLSVGAVPIPIFDGLGVPNIAQPSRISLERRKGVKLGGGGGMKSSSFGFGASKPSTGFTMKSAPVYKAPAAPLVKSPVANIPKPPPPPPLPLTKPLTTTAQKPGGLTFQQQIQQSAAQKSTAWNNALTTNSQVNKPGSVSSFMNKYPATSAPGVAKQSVGSTLLNGLTTAATMATPLLMTYAMTKQQQGVPMGAQPGGYMPQQGYQVQQGYSPQQGYPVQQTYPPQPQQVDPQLQQMDPQQQQLYAQQQQQLYAQQLQQQQLEAQQQPQQLEAQQQQQQLPPVQEQQQPQLQ